MGEWINNIAFWHWWILAGLLLISELLLPVFFFLWLGIAAAATGLIMLVFPDIPLQTQLVLFAVLSVVAVVAWRRYREVSVPTSDQPHLNRRGRQYIGREFTLHAPIENGVGNVEVDDSIWRVKCPDLAAGTRVVVTDLDGVVLVVRAS